MYDIRIEVYSDSYSPIKVFNQNATQTHKIVRLLYLAMSHYDSFHFNQEERRVIAGEFGVMERNVIQLAKDRVKDRSTTQKNNREVADRG